MRTAFRRYLSRPLLNGLAFVLSLALLACASRSASEDAPPRKFEMYPCEQNLARDVRCGYIQVPENWGDSNGRSINLDVAIILAKRSKDDAPLFVLAGGPGTPVTELTDRFLSEYAAYRERRDVVLVDLRGTGGANALHCRAAEPPRPDLANAYANPYTLDVMSACRDKLQPRADLSAYNTPSAAKDLDAIREALEYPQIYLKGISYGTTLALEYMRAYPQRVRVAVLESTAPARNMPAVQMAPSAQRSLDALIAKCEAISTCKSRYPDIRGDLRAVFRKLSQNGGFTAKASAKTAATQFLMSPAEFMEEIRGLLSISPLARVIPRVVHEAARGDFQPFVDATLPGKLKANGFARGLYFSSICTEGYSHLDLAAHLAEARSTMFGDYRVRTQADVCRIWPTKKLDDAFYSTLPVSVPTLFISGELDPITPPAWAADISRTFMTARQVIIPGMGHTPATEAEDRCIVTLEEAFLRNSGPASLDASCVANIPFEPFQ